MGKRKPNYFGVLGGTSLYNLLATKQRPSHQPGINFPNWVHNSNPDCSLQDEKMLYPIPDISHNLLYDDCLKNKKTALGSVNIYVKDVDELSMKLPANLLIRSVEKKVGVILLYRVVFIHCYGAVDPTFHCFIGYEDCFVHIYVVYFHSYREFIVYLLTHFNFCVKKSTVVDSRDCYKRCYWNGNIFLLIF